MTGDTASGSGQIVVCRRVVPADMIASSLFLVHVFTVVPSNPEQGHWTCSLTVQCTWAVLLRCRFFPLMFKSRGL